MAEKNKKIILIVDDDHPHRTMLKTLISDWGYNIDEADDGSTAIKKAYDKYYDLILMDVRMVKVSGLQALVKIKEFNPAIPIIIMTAFSSVEKAVKALKQGAHDYLTKPLDFEKLKITIKRAMEHSRLERENKILRETAGIKFDKRNIIGRSPKIVKLLETVARVAPTEATILITGESGTGKELIAGAIHYNSERKKHPFVKINCAAITESLLESELFGHEKGAFTGADRLKEGKFVQAHQGSLLLDEVSEMSLTMQVKLLRVLQEREVTRVGGERVIMIDVRLIAATNKNLEQCIQRDAFREDLYYRLNVIQLKIPPLRKRREDIPLLAQRFIKVFSEKNRKNISGFTPEAMDRLIRHRWPGNVRELMNTVERGVVLAKSDYITEADLLMTKEEDKYDVSLSIRDVLGSSLKDVEKLAVLKTLEDSEGNKSEAARRLGITRKTLHKKLKEYMTDKRVEK